MKLRYRLLDHPFYQAWNRGEVSLRQLSEYATSYAELIKEMPAYWEKISSLNKQESSVIKRIIGEEKEHIAMWDVWRSGLELNQGLL